MAKKQVEEKEQPETKPETGFLEENEQSKEILQGVEPEERGLVEKPEEKTEEKPEEKTEGKEEEKPEEKTEEKPEEKNQDLELLKQYKLEKFKSVKDALEAYKNLESAYGKVVSSLQRGSLPEEIKDGIIGARKIISQPRVNINPPDPTNYLDDEGNIHLQDYLRDTLAQYTIALQKALVEGQLGAALYTIQKEAVLSNFQKLAEEQNKAQVANEILETIFNEYPIYKDDYELQELLSMALDGAVARKKSPLTKEEILSLAKKVALKKQTEVQEKEQVVEKLKGSPPLSLEKKKRNPQEEAVDELLQLSMKRQEIF